MMRTRPILLLLFAVLCSAAWSQAADTARDQLPNGLRVLARQTTASQVVSLELLIDYTALDEPASLQGLRRVLLSALLQASTAEDVSSRRRLALVGGTLEGRVHPDMLEFTVTAPADALDVGMAALADVVLRAQLTDEGIKAAVLQAYRTGTNRRADALDVAMTAARETVYGAHPYGGDGVGTAATLSRITPAMVRDVYRRYMTPQAAVLAIAGRCDPQEAREAAVSAFGAWAGAPRPVRSILRPATLDRSELVFREAPATAACVMLSFPVCGATDHDFLVLRVVDSLLGGGTGARLFRSVRERYHLAYEVASIFPTQAACSHFSIYALTRGTYLEETKSALLAELSRLQVEPVSADELQRAKAYLKGRYLLSHQYSAQLAFDLAWYELIGLGSAYDQTLPAAIDAVTAADLQRVARTYFTHYCLAVVVPQTGPSGE